MRKRSNDPSRERILQAAKALFARQGYENTSTSAIAQEAQTSESQLVRYFGGKAGLLEAIFDHAWLPLNARVHDLLADATSGRAAVDAVLAAVLATLERDDDLTAVLLFEGRRIRGGDSEVRLSAGFLQFTDVIVRLVKRGQRDGSFAAGFDAAALSAALIGAAEAMVRERLMMKRAGVDRPFSDKQVRRVFIAMLDGFAS